MKGSFELVCFDMDGTLIRNTNSVRYLCCLNGKENEVIEIENRENRKEISWIDADYLKAKLLRGLELKYVKEEFDKRIELISGIGHVMKYLKGKNVKTILVTSGPVQVASILGEKYGFDGVFGSDYEIENGCFTGKIINHLGTVGKLRCLLSFCKERGIDLQKCVAIGDSDSDIEIFEECGKSIAINYSDTLLGRADVYIRTEDLRDILKYF
ncbi:HAD family hydrolase [Kosmotoga pacifica]|uniref:phosphoserine phosphatase n=1 Tax=Kosmotoga pacifica TaxID=1330330 RepID=A0A0G2ZET2_9BACT|nr:HAD family phosphatase [Kosmotoga pacifica]AKI97343.1 haloacid dehalogenase [Kosmotoga pacifica]